MVKNLPVMQETWVQSLGWEDHVEKGMASYSSVLPGESHGQRSLVGHSLWGHKESDTTEQLTLSLFVGSGSWLEKIRGLLATVTMGPSQFQR